MEDVAVDGRIITIYFKDTEQGFVDWIHQPPDVDILRGSFEHGCDSSAEK